MNNQKRNMFLRELRSLGVSTPSAMYPKRELLSDPETLLDRMASHVCEIQSTRSAQAEVEAEAEKWESLA